MSGPVQEIPARPVASARALLDGIIDYAGLFPPAGLSMMEAVRRYERYLRGPTSWMLARFVVPAARLDELVTARASLGEPAPVWRTSVLVDATSLAQDLARVACACARDPAITVDSLEARLGDAAGPAEVDRLAGAVGHGPELFVEIPVAADPSPRLRAIAASRLRAKVRTGGTTPGAFPRSAELARFLLGCAEHGVAFKATAGLHHPVRGCYRLTYDIDAPSASMFGFLSVFVAAAIARAGSSVSDVRCLLEEEDASALRFEGSGLWWRDIRLSTEAIRETRRELARSFGSCSFEEPVQDLRALGLL